VSAIVTLSRNLRWMRVLTVRRNHVPVADSARLEDAAAEQHQPQREQRVGQGGELR
jgi:hypothetical protein